MVENRKFGWIECICGSMFSGKSEELLRRIKRGVIAKQKVLYLNQVLIIDMMKTEFLHIMVIAMIQ